VLPRLRNLGAMGPVLTRPIRWDLIARQFVPVHPVHPRGWWRQARGDRAFPAQRSPRLATILNSGVVRRHVRVAVVVVIFAGSVRCWAAPSPRWPCRCWASWSAT